MADTRFRITPVLTPDAVASINRAYADAIALVREQRDGRIRHQLASHVMFLARSGETDEQRLASQAVLSRSAGRVPPGAAGHAPIDGA